MKIKILSIWHSTVYGPIVYKALLMFVILVLASTANAFEKEHGGAVVLSETATSFSLDNGIVTATISKANGRLSSLIYHGISTVEVGYWSHSPSGNVSSRISIDPKNNGGERGEVSIKAISEGNRLGSGPGGSAIMDIELRYTMERGASGIYTYGTYTHTSDYLETSVGEARFCAKLNDGVFDWLTIDSNRNLKVITAYDWDHGVVMNGKEMRRMTTGQWKGQVEHKYDYTNNQFETPVWGWSSTEKHVGIWFVNPSVEYLSGGPTKSELSAHRDATFGSDPNAPAPPCLLNYWRSSHYGGSILDIGKNESWTKVVGPFFIYCNAGSDHDGLRKDAIAQSIKQSAAWPYDWVNGVDYPHKKERGQVAGKLVLDDSQATTTTFSRLLVGLSHPDEKAKNGELIDWQLDAKHYEFWVLADKDGSFKIPNVRPGTYTLHAIADGVLGEYTLPEITVTGGKSLTLGDLKWKPVRFGLQLWDIGIPNRSGSEFFKGDNYFHWGWYLEYPKLFPNDVNFIIGKSDFRKDWFFEQVPHNEDTTNTNGKVNGRSTTWTISFNIAKAPIGKAVLRLALAGTESRSISVSVNGVSAGVVTGLHGNGVIHRDGIAGIWQEKTLEFDAGLMNAGQNNLALTIPAGGITSGIIYDYLRLELDESKN